jgi:hypothetical protein
MHSIYLYNSLHGTGRDFLAGQLSDDPGFYPLSFRKNYNNGRYEPAHPLRYFDINYWSEYKLFEISDDESTRINEFFSAKSLIIPITYVGSLLNINLPRLTHIQINFTARFGPLFYTLSIIEKGMDTYKITSDELSAIKEIDPDQNDPLSQCIKDRDHLYDFEKQSLRHKFTNSLHFIKYNYKGYIIAAYRRPEDCTCFQLDDLFINPKDNVKEFCNLVGRESVIDYRKIEEFHTDRILALEKTFNKSYKNYVLGNWRDELVEWVRNKCY